ncbi:cysteine hydrolase [Patescibacteria group bacterium]|nr:cysteine hydrolase [Patescibacteria group bacterium]
MKEFVFLYPIPEYIDHEVKNHGWFEKGGTEVYREKYKGTLNECINLQYRKKGFGINYVIFDGHAISDTVDVQPPDRIIEAGMDFETHTTKQSNGEFLYPDPDHILNQISEIKTVRIAGFHLWDCVERLARRAHERGLDVLVDEDLTELFGGMLKQPGFTIDKFPSFDPRTLGDSLYQSFITARREGPWLWQDYPEF